MIGEATLNNMLFPVQRPGEHITAEWELFFFYFLIFYFFLGQKFHFFTQKKKETEKKEDFAAARPAIITANRWTGNKLFFKGGLKYKYVLVDGAEGEDINYQTLSLPYLVVINV